MTDDRWDDPKAIPLYVQPHYRVMTEAEFADFKRRRLAAREAGALRPVVLPSSSLNTGDRPRTTRPGALLLALRWLLVLAIIVLIITAFGIATAFVP